MTLIIEVCIFLLIILGIIILSFTMFNKNNCIKEVYTREKINGETVLLEVKYIGIKEEDIQDISRIIASGNFNNIYDIVDEFKVYKKEE